MGKKEHIKRLIVDFRINMILKQEGGDEEEGEKKETIYLREELRAS